MPKITPLSTGSDDAVTTAKIEDEAVTFDKLDDGAVGTSKLGGEAVTTAKIDDDAVTGAKLNVNVVDDVTLQQTGTTLNIKDGGVDTVQIKDKAVTQVKLAARAVTTDGTDPGVGGVSISVSSAGNHYSNSVTPVDINNLSVTLTTTGRPIFIGLISNSTSTNGAYITVYQQSGVSLTDATGRVMILEGSTEIARHGINTEGPTASDDLRIRVPVSSINHIDTQIAGTYTYKIQCNVYTTDHYVGVREAKLVAYEL